MEARLVWSNLLNTSDLQASFLKALLHNPTGMWMCVKFHAIQSILRLKEMFVHRVLTGRGLHYSAQTIVQLVKGKFLLPAKLV